MHAHYQLVGLDTLMAHSSGNPALKIGIIDGPVWWQAPQFAKQIFLRMNNPAPPIENADAYYHATVITGLLAARRNQAVLGICPNCTFLVESIFCTPQDSCLVAQPATLAAALVGMVTVGAHIINLSLGMLNYHTPDLHLIQQAIDRAEKAGVLVIVAAGNQGQIGSLPLANHPWLIPVVACDSIGKRHEAANLGLSIGRQGLKAPGVDVTGLTPDGQAALFTGTSFAVPFVTGTAALLWSLHPEARALQIRRALLGKRSRRSIIPPLLQAKQALDELRTML